MKENQKKYVAYACATKLLYDCGFHLAGALRGCAGVFVSTEDLEKNIGLNIETLFTESQTSIDQLDSDDRNKFENAVWRIKNSTCHAELVEAGNHSLDVARVLDVAKMKLATEFRQVEAT